jgi:integrase
MHGSLELNDRLQYLKAEVVRQYRKMIMATPRVTLPQVKALVTKILDDGLPDFDNKSLIECLAEFIEERRSILSPLTTKKYNTLSTSLSEWMEWNNVNQNQFTCDSIDADFELSYKKYLIEDRRLTNNSISKYLECIKRFMRWARKKGYHNSSVFEDFSIKRNRSEVIWVNETELTQLVSYQSDDADLMRVKHVFLFMIYTAQRYLDYKNLRRRDVVINPDNTFDWVLYQRKATKTVRVTIPLIKDAVDILEKFGFSNKQLNDCLIPIGENAIFNKSIKVLCEQAGLDSPLTIVKVVGNERVELHYKKFQKISCHTSRKSWVSLSLQRGLNPEYLTAVTGHQSLKTLREHYVGLDHESKRKAVNKIWENNANNQ